MIYTRLTLLSRMLIPGVAYMTSHHAQSLREAGASENEVRAVTENPGAGEYGESDAKEQAVVQFCEKFTRLPSPMARSDLEALREKGFEDKDLLTIVASAAFENFLGRVAVGLGVGLETDAEASATDGTPLGKGGKLI